MTACDDFILKMENTLPDIVDTHDLVKLGLYRSIQSAYHSRLKHKSPAYFAVGKRIFYPKAAVLDWLKENKGDESIKVKNIQTFQSV